MSTEKTATAEQLLDEAGERIRDAAHAAIRDHPTPQEVSTRIGALKTLVEKLEQHLTGNASRLLAHAENPALRSTADPDAAGVARLAVVHLAELAAGKYLAGLLAELNLAFSATETLWLDEQLEVDGGEDDTL